MEGFVARLAESAKDPNMLAKMDQIERSDV